MERNQAANKIQAGRTGEGFEAPHQVSTTSQTKYEEAVQVMCKEIGTALFHEDLFQNSDHKIRKFGKFHWIDTCPSRVE